MGELIKAITYARLKGLHQRHVRRLIQRNGMPAKKQAGTWYVDAADTDEWIAEHCPRLSARLSGPNVRTECPHAGPRPKPLASPTADSPGEGIDQHIARLDQILAAFIGTLHDGHFDARAVTGIKQVSGELRMLERHRVEMRERENQLVPKEHYERFVNTLARIVVEEIQAFAPRVPETILATLAEAGVKIDDRMMRQMNAQAEAQADALRTRIADALEASEI